MAAWYERRWGKHGHGLGKPSSPPGRGRREGPGRGRGRPGRGGGGGASTPLFAVTRVAANTSTGTQDITISGLGWTPKAALFNIVRASVDGTVADHAASCIGATDGTNQWVTSFMHEWNSGSGANQAHRRGATDEVIMMLNPTTGGLGGIEAEANFDSFIADGVRINWGVAPGTAWLVEVWLFGGGATYNAGTATLATTGNATTVSIGSQMNGLIVASNAIPTNGFADSEENGQQNIHLGFGSYDGSTISQGCWASSSFLGGGSATECRGQIRDDSVFTFAGSAARATLENITATSFDLGTEVADLSAFDVGYLAMSGCSAYATVHTAPTSTGNSDYTGAAFTPTMAIFSPTAHDTVNTVRDGVNGGFSSGFGFAGVDGTREFCQSVAIEDGVALTDTQSLSDDVAIRYYNHSGATQLHNATFDSFLADGVRLNHSVANGTARKFLNLFLG